MQVLQLWKERNWYTQELRNTTKSYHTTNLTLWERQMVAASAGMRTGQETGLVGRSFPVQRFLQWELISHRLEASPVIGEFLWSATGKFLSWFSPGSGLRSFTLHYLRCEDVCCISSPQEKFCHTHNSIWKLYIFIFIIQYDNSIFIWNNMHIARLDRILNRRLS